MTDELENLISSKPWGHWSPRSLAVAISAAGYSRAPSAEGRLQIALRDLFEIIERIDIRHMVGERTAVRVKEQARAALRGEP